LSGKIALVTGGSPVIDLLQQFNTAQKERI